MEFKEYVAIFRKKIKLFMMVVGLFLLAGVIFHLAQKSSYKASLTINVTRNGAQQTNDYKYDDFYRLQADERFADTVVRWLESPRIATDILVDSGADDTHLSIRKLSRYFRAQRLSSQMINVDYIISDPGFANKLSKSVLKIINSNADALDERQKTDSWFIVVGDNPVVRENNADLSSVLLACFLIGIFIGSWAVFIKHYME